MAGDIFKRVQPGEPLKITAAAWNAALEAARAHREGVAQGTSAPAFGEADYTVVLVRNNTASAVDRFGVLAVGDPLILPSDSLDTFAETVAFEGDEPTGSDGGNWCVLLEPIPPDGIGRAVISGVIPVLVAAGSGAEGYVQPASADTEKLEFSATGSARVLWEEGAGDPRWSLVRLGDGAGVGGSPLEVSTWDGSTETEIEDETGTIRFDARDGFQVTLAATGIVLVRVQAATASQAGIVSTGSQTFGGNKTFTGTVEVSSSGSHYKFAGNSGTSYGRLFKRAADQNTVLENVSGGVVTTLEVTQYAILGNVDSGSGIVAAFNALHDRFTILAGATYRVGSAVGQTHTDAFGGEYTGGILTTAPSSYNLADLDDVDMGSPSTGDVLIFNGSEWEAAAGTSGTVTSVGVSGGTTGLTTSGGPVTSSGTITLGGTLAIANGGTGQTTAAAALDALLPSQGGNAGKVLATDGSTHAWEAILALAGGEISVTGATTATVGRMHAISGTSSSYTIGLPPASGNAGKLIGFRVASSGATKLYTLDGDGSETIDGATTRILWAGESAFLLCDGTSWHKVAGKPIPMTCRMHYAASSGSYQSAASTANQLVPLNTTDRDSTGLMANTGSNQIDIVRGGLYQVTATVFFAGTAAGAVLTANAPVVAANLSAGGSFTNVGLNGFFATTQGTADKSLATGDVLELFGYQDSANTQYLHGGTFCWLEVCEKPTW